ncbi:ATP-dependent helicase, partial [Pseudomonas aeruginosa]|nr:ATP-dependent helicase [Pseudomonas aeruginosa]
ELSHMPNGMHAVVPAQPELGLLPGVIFTLRNRNHGVDINQQNRLYPYYLIYIDNDGRVISDYSEAKRLLDLARTACKGQRQPIREAYQCFNQITDDGRNMQAYSNLLDQAIHSMIEVKEEKDIDSLFSGGKTTALVDTFVGLADFELITFIVIQDVA